MTWTNDRNERIDFPCFFFFSPTSYHLPDKLYDLFLFRLLLSAGHSVVRFHVFVNILTRNIYISPSPLSPPPPSSSTNSLTYDVAHHPSRYRYLLLHTLPITTYHTCVLLINSIPPLPFPVPLLCSFFDRLGFYFQDRPFGWSECRKGVGSFPSEFFLPLDLPDGWIHGFGGWQSRQMNEWTDFSLPVVRHSLPPFFPFLLFISWPH